MLLLLVLKDILLSIFREIKSEKLRLRIKYLCDCWWYNVEKGMLLYIYKGSVRCEKRSE